MASSDEIPEPMPPGDGSIPPGKPTTVGQHVLDKGAQMMQSLKPIKRMSQHVCTFAAYSHDMTRQIETHHYVARLNQDFLQCAVYDSDDSTARLIGVEYIVSDRIFDTLPAEEQKLWHSHASEIKSGLWVNPRVPEMIERPELNNLAQTYGKFWCTWQVDRGDRLPLSAPALMMSPQEVNLGIVKPELVKKRDEKYKISTDDVRKSRVNITAPEPVIPRAADYWKQTGKGFAVDIEQTAMKLRVQVGEAQTKEDVYSVWALPPEDVTERFNKLMGGLRSEVGGPEFEPHVTVVGAISLTESDARDKFRAACEGLKAYTASVQKVATGTFFYQCVFLLLHPTAEVMEAGAHCTGHFGYKSSTPYMPHLSILYGDLTDEEKKRAQEKANSLDEGINSLRFPITRLALCKTDTEDKTLKSWEKVAEFTLHIN